jgi:DNA ligase-1
MKMFSALVRNLHDGATDRINNLALIDYFKEADQTDVLWAIYLLLGNRPGRAIANSILREWAVEEMELPTWLFEESLKVSGDLAETIAILLPYEDQTHNISLSKVVRGLKHLGSLEITQKQQYVNKIWKVLEGAIQFVALGCYFT